MMEQSRQARKFFDLAWLGMGAEGAVDPMVEEESIFDYINLFDSITCARPQTRIVLLRPTHWLANKRPGDTRSCLFVQKCIVLILLDKTKKDKTLARVI